MQFPTQLAKQTSRVAVAMAQAACLDDEVRSRCGADDRSHQPLQHDVRPVLHGRQPGRLRPRAVLGRHQAHPRQRHQRQAAPPDERPVLRRRADAVALLPRRDPLRPRGRLLCGAGRDERHRVRQEPGVCPPGRRGRSAHAYLQFDGIGNEPTRTARSANLFDVKLRAIEDLHGPASTSSGVTIVNGVNNEQVGTHHRVRARQPDKITVRVVPAGELHRAATRTRPTMRREPSSATRCRTSCTT
jgi:hypothetical protein